MCKFIKSEFVQVLISSMKLWQICYCPAHEVIINTDHQKTDTHTHTLTQHDHPVCLLLVHFKSLLFQKPSSTLLKDYFHYVSWIFALYSLLRLGLKNKYGKKIRVN